MLGVEIVFHINKNLFHPQFGFLKRVWEKLFFREKSFSHKQFPLLQKGYDNGLHFL